MLCLFFTNIQTGKVCRGKGCQTSTAEVSSTTEMLPNSSVVATEKIDQTQVFKKPLVIDTDGPTQIFEVKNNDTLVEDSPENTNITISPPTTMEEGRNPSMESTETVDQVEGPAQGEEDATPATQPGCEEFFENTPGTIASVSPHDKNNTPDCLESLPSQPLPPHTLFGIHANGFSHNFNLYL